MPRSFRTCIDRIARGQRGGIQIRIIGIDPLRNAAPEHVADNETTPERTAPGRRAHPLVECNSGEAAYREQGSGRTVESSRH